jgi:chromosome segregation ATPase
VTNGDTSSHDEYMPVEAVADRLRLSVRQATRYAERVRTLKKGRRIYYHRDDVEALADELNVEERVPTPPRTEMMPAGEVMQTFERQQERIAQLERERGRLEGVLTTQQRLLEDADETRRRLEEVTAERDRLRAENERLQARSWWQRLRGR